MHLSRLGLLVHLVASLPWWHPSTSALPWHGSILGSVVSAVNARPGMAERGFPSAHIVLAGLLHFDFSPFLVAVPSLWTAV